MKQLNVHIMGQAYTLACKEGEERTLREAIAYLDNKMSNLRDTGKILGNDRIAVIAALGIAAELLASKAPSGPLAGLTVSEVKQNITAMHTVLDEALAAQEYLF